MTSKSPQKAAPGAPAAAEDVFDHMDREGKGVAPREEVDAFLREVCEMSGDEILHVWMDVWKKEEGSREVDRQAFVKAAQKLAWPVGRELGKKRLEAASTPPASLLITVVGASNLPSGGLTGSHELYFSVSAGGKLQRTLAKKDDADPKIEETFGFSVSERPGELNIKLMQTHTLTKDEIVAEAFWGQKEVADFLASPSGTKTTLTLPLYKHRNPAGGGDPLKSKAGDSSMVITVCLMREGQYGPPPASKDKDQGDQGMLFVEVRGAESLPKADFMGKADSYVSVKYLGQERRTTLIKYSYEPEWQETFGFKIGAGWLEHTGVAPRLGEQEEYLVASICNWSRMGSDKTVGSIKIPTAEIVSLLQRESKAALKKILTKHEPEGGSSSGSSFTSGGSSSSFSLTKSFSLSKRNLQDRDKDGKLVGDDCHNSTLTLVFSLNRSSKFDKWWQKQNVKKGKKV